MLEFQEVTGGLRVSESFPALVILSVSLAHACIFICTLSHTRTRIYTEIQIQGHNAVVWLDTDHQLIPLPLENRDDKPPRSHRPLHAQH